MQKALTNLQENLNIPPDKWAKDINNSLKGKLRKLISRRKKKNLLSFLWISTKCKCKQISRYNFPPMMLEKCR